MKYIVTVDNRSFVVTLEEAAEGHLRLALDGQPRRADMKNIGDVSLYSLLLDHKSYELFIESCEGEEDGASFGAERFRVLLRGQSYEVRVQSERPKPASQRGWAPPVGEIIIKAPIPGLVVEVPVSVGQSVAEQEVVLILESMKMENELRAPRAGVVRAIHVAAGDTADLGQPLITLE